MADITKQTELTTAWKNVDTAFSWEDEKTYVLDVILTDRNATVFSADTDTDDAPSTAIHGHPWEAGEGYAAREVTPVDGVRTWMRTDRGTATIVSTEVMEEE